MLARSLLLTALSAVLPALSFAQVTGTPAGFGSKTTGGGDATPAYPSDIAELREWLEDDTARVIMLNKEYNFVGSLGETTENGCRPDSNTCPNDGGQDAINGANWCSSSYPTVSVTYDVAGTEPIQVGSNKSLVGVGSAGAIKGIGLAMKNGVSNIIIQNIAISDLNPEYIWGGDILTLAGTDNIWIDHCTFSLTGRQMLVTGYDQAGAITISNNEFNGVTDWSATCNDDHYWTMLFYGDNDRVTLANNYIHDCSGRAPKIGTDGSSVHFHAVNNYFSNMQGHSFDIGTGASVLIEGNVYDNVDTPITSASATAGGSIFTVASGTESTCSSYLGRECVGNSISNSGTFTNFGTEGVLSGFSGYDVWGAMDVSDVAEYVVANAGVGKL